MVVAVDVEDDVVRLWSRTSDGIVVQRDHDYTPTCYVAGPDDALADLRARLESDPKIVQMEWDRQFLNLRDEAPTRVLAVSLERPSEIVTFAREVRTVHEPGGATGGSIAERSSGNEVTREPGGTDRKEGPSNERAGVERALSTGWTPEPSDCTTST